MKYKKAKISALLFIFGFSLSILAQIAPNTYWISFTDKNNSIYTLEKPEEFLSERSINRRMNQTIDLNEEDLPVSQFYLDSLQKLGIKIHNTSKWLNGAAIISTDSLLLDTVHYLSFIQSPITKKKTLKIKSTANNKLPQITYSNNSYYAESQLEMLNIDKLHADDFKGGNILIGILDSGFKNAKTIESLQHIWSNNKVLAIKDFVKDSNDIFEIHYHGTLVFSIIAGNWQDNLLGAAPEADYVLIRTENDASENLLEEYDWISGAEYADSLGIDIINSSLGYSEFDDASQNHTYEDLNGSTTPITIAASIAARKGILVITSAGNSGNESWYYITAPADADSILAIGSVTIDEQISSFSSRGPTSDGRIKPDVCALGEGTAGQINENMLLYCNGTSCSAPLIAGMAACLWQASPQATSYEIRASILKSAHLYHTPDNNYGYGIPNALIAKDLLPTSSNFTQIQLYPNPTQSSLTLKMELPWLTKQSIATYQIIDLNGQQLVSSQTIISAGINIFEVSEVVRLDSGYYIAIIHVEGRNYQLPFIKFL
jgi:hypothetical protein